MGEKIILSETQVKLDINKKSGFGLKCLNISYI